MEKLVSFMLWTVVLAGHVSGALYAVAVEVRRDDEIISAGRRGHLFWE